MPRTRRGVVGGGLTSVALAPPGSLQYPNRRWVRHQALLGGRMLLCDCECGLHLTADGRLCVGEDGGIYGVAYCCPVCDVSLCGACHDAGYAHHQHRRSHTMEAMQPPPPSLQSGPGHAPLSAPPPSPRTVEQLQGVHCVTYDTYETDVYADERDCLVYYHLTATPQLPLSHIVEQVRAEVQRGQVEAEGGEDGDVRKQWAGADSYTSQTAGHELDCIASAYLPWLLHQLSEMQSERQPMLAVMDVRRNMMDWDWLPRRQRQYPCFVLHPAQARKRHADFALRNVRWEDCYTFPAERMASELHPSDMFHPLFRVEYAMPTLEAFVTWLHTRCAHQLPLSALLAEALAVQSAAEWVRRGAAAARQLTYLVAQYGHELPLDTLAPGIPEAADGMLQLVGAGRRYATLQAVGSGWCEQHIPAVEQLVSEWMSTSPIQAARATWLERREQALAWQSTPRSPLPPQTPLLDGADPSSLVREVNNASFASIVLDRNKDVLLAVWEEDNGDLYRNLGLCFRVLLPAIARLLQRCTPIGTAAVSGTATSATDTSLVLAVKAKARGGSEEPMKPQWMDPLLYRSAVQSVGALAMYPAGDQPQEDDFDFYSLYRDVYNDSIDMRQLDKVKLRDFYEQLHPPSLSALCRWMHGTMRGGSFDLQQLLTLAAPYEEANHLLGRVLTAHFDASSAEAWQLFPFVHDDTAEVDWPADVRVQRAVHNTYFRLCKTTLEELAEQQNMTQVAAVLDAWRHCSLSWDRRRAARQAEEEEGEDDGDEERE